MIEQDVLGRLVAGAEIVAETVGGTAGPGGNYVLSDDRGYLWPRATRDGVSVARVLHEDGLQEIGEVEGLGAKLVIQAANQQLKAAGDGTTAVCVLAAAIAREGMKSVRAGHSVQKVRRELEAASSEAISALNKAGIKQFSMENVLRVACGEDEAIAHVVGEVLGKVGESGHITWEPFGGGNSEVKAEYTQGFQWSVGLESGLFCTDRAKGELRYEAPRFLVIDKTIRYIDEIAGICGAAAAEGFPLVIVCPDIGGDALPALVATNLEAMQGKQGLLCCVVRPEGIGSAKQGFFEDLAAFTGATLISDERGVPPRSLTLSHLGRAAKFFSNRYLSCVIDGEGLTDELKTRLSSESKDAPEEYDKELAGKRHARLCGAVATIKVSAPTDSDLRERLDRVDDAVRAGKCAMETGVIEGGGQAYLLAAKAIHGDSEGARILRKALWAPMRKIISNAGHPADYIIENIVRGNELGWDVGKGVFCDMISSGIIDPVKVGTCAIQNAVSVASLLLGCGSVIVKRSKGANSGNELNLSERLAKS